MAGRLYGIGVGPGDPELMTLKAARLIKAAPVLAYFAKRGSRGHGRAIVEGYLSEGITEEALIYPATTEIPVSDPAYETALRDFYDQCAERLKIHLDQGRAVAVISEGDPFLYGSFMPLFHRLSDRYQTEVVPGVAAMAGCWARAMTPIAYGDDTLAILPATLPIETLREHLSLSQAAVVMKLGRNFVKVKQVLDEMGLTRRAIYVERGTMTGERILPLDRVTGEAPYFALVLVPGLGRRL